MSARKPAPTRGRYAKTAETRATLARAALEIVYEKGHAALTTAEVAQRAGVSETTRFYHFPTRDHLLVAALELADHDSEARYSLSREREDAGWNTVFGAIARDGMGRNRAVLLLFTALSAEAPNPDHPAHDYFKRHNAGNVRAFAEGIRRRQAQGLAHPDLDPDAVARQLQGIWRGLQSQWLVEPSFDLADEVQQAFRMLSGQTAMETKQAIGELMATL